MVVLSLLVMPHDMPHRPFAMLTMLLDTESGISIQRLWEIILNRLTVCQCDQHGGPRSDTTETFLQQQALSSLSKVYLVQVFDEYDFIASLVRMQDFMASLLNVSKAFMQSVVEGKVKKELLLVIVFYFFFILFIRL